jgi:tetratricopeptide (TPR) repeat protein
LLQHQGHWNEALRSYQQAIRYRPKLAAAHLNLGVTLVLLNRKAEAEHVFAQCAELSGLDLKDWHSHRRHQTSALMQLGRLLAERGEHRLAIEAYRKALQRRPVGFETHTLLNVLGEAHFQLGEMDEAELWYGRSLQSKPTHVPAHLTLAKLFQRTSRPSDALQSYRNALQLAPDDPNVLLHYGKSVFLLLVQQFQVESNGRGDDFRFYSCLLFAERNDTNRIEMKERERERQFDGKWRSFRMSVLLASSASNVNAFGSPKKTSPTLFSLPLFANYMHTRPETVCLCVPVAITKAELGERSTKPSEEGGDALANVKCMQMTATFSTCL